MAVRLVVVVVGSCLLVGGCSRSMERGEIEGVVTLNGVPLPDVQIVLTPEGTSEGRTRATGFTDREGKYRIRCDSGEPGIPVGRYVVVVTDPRSLRMPGGADKAGKTRPSASRVPARYTRFNESPLKADVRAGSQTCNLELARQGGK